MIPSSSSSLNPATLKYLHQDELDRLLRAIRNPRDRAIFTVGYWRGLRAAEVGMLQIRDWIPASKRLRVHRVKGGLGGEYVVSDPESRAITAWLKQYPVTDLDAPLFPSERRDGISRQRLDALMKLYGAKSGLDPAKRHFHALRHSIAVHLTDAGHSLQDVKDWLGHKSIMSTTIYAQVSSKRRVEAGREFYESSGANQVQVGKGKGSGSGRVKWGRGKR